MIFLGNWAKAKRFEAVANFVLTNKAESAPQAIWAVILILSAAPRLLAVWLWPNVDWDAYAYLEAINRMRGELAAHTFSLGDLFGFWLPLYQFVCAAASLVTGETLFTAKFISAICGTVVCLLVFAVSWRITENWRWAFLSWLLIALNPFHIFYSASSMTDVPSACLLLGSLYLALRQRWFWAALLIACAGLMRVEMWAFILVLPVLQWFLARRISLAGWLIMLAAPALWLAISWVATGDAGRYFVVRQEYIDGFRADAPARAALTISSTVYDFSLLCLGANPVVLLLSLICGGLILRRWRNRETGAGAETVNNLSVSFSYFFVVFGSLSLAYLTRQQPVILTRYGLILQALGLPLAAWTLLELRRLWPRKFRYAVLAFVLGGIILSLGQAALMPRILRQVQSQRLIGAYLNNEALPQSSGRIFCDDPTVRILSGLPQEKFVSSQPVWQNQTDFLAALRDRQVEYLVFLRMDSSLPSKFWPELGNGAGNRFFQPVDVSGLTPTQSAVVLYRALNE